MKRRAFVHGLAACTLAPGTMAGISTPKRTFYQEKFEWKMVRQSQVNRKHKDFVRIIVETSQGQLKINLISRGKKSYTEVLDEIRTGNTHMAFGGFLVSPSEKEGEKKVYKVPAAALLIIPFGLSALEYNAWIEFGGGYELVSKIYERIGCKYFPAGNTGIQMGGWFAKKINSIEDLKGLKIRISGFGAEAMKALGDEPYDVAPWSNDAINALVAGKLDAFELGNPISDLNRELQKRYKYYYFPAWHEPSVPFALLINHEKWKSLPPYIKTIISTTARWLNYHWINERTAAAVDALDALIKKHGVQLRQFPDAVLRELKKATKEIMREYTDRDPLSQEVYDSIMLFKKKVSAWAKVSHQPFLKARGSL